MSAIDPAIPSWPRILAPGATSPPTLLKPALEGPQPLSSPPQTVVADMGFWQLQLADMPIHDGTPANPLAVTGSRVMLWRSLYNGWLADGLPIYMRLFDWNRGPRARAGLPLLGASVPHDDGSGFSDGMMYAQPTGDCVFAADAAERATSVSVDVLTAAVPTAGDYVSVGDRLHFIAQAWPDEVVADRYTWRLRPGLRYAATAGDEIEIADPICKMVLSPRDRSTLLRMDYGRIGRATLTFYEANWS